MAYFPLFIDIEGKQVLVVGGGQIAERRIRALTEFGCRIVLVSPEATEGLGQMAQDGKIHWIRDRYSRKYLRQSIELPDDRFRCESGRTMEWIFVLAAADHEINEMVTKDCRHAGIPVNNASDKDDCDFYFPGLVKEQHMVVGITSEGTDHKAVAALVKKIRELVQKTWQV